MHARSHTRMHALSRTCAHYAHTRMLKCTPYAHTTTQKDSSIHMSSSVLAAIESGNDDEMISPPAPSSVLDAIDDGSDGELGSWPIAVANDSREHASDQEEGGDMQDLVLDVPASEPDVPASVMESAAIPAGAMQSALDAAADAFRDKLSHILQQQLQHHTSTPALSQQTISGGPAGAPTAKKKCGRPTNVSRLAQQSSQPSVSSFFSPASRAANRNLPVEPVLSLPHLPLEHALEPAAPSVEVERAPESLRVRIREQRKKDAEAERVVEELRQKVVLVVFLQPYHIPNI